MFFGVEPDAGGTNRQQTLRTFAKISDELSIMVSTKIIFHFIKNYKI